MYGGVGGEMMAEGGVTSMPDSGGSSGSVIPGSDGGSSTPPNRDNELTNPNGLPVPSWTPRQGSGENAAIQPLLDAIARAITSHRPALRAKSILGFGASLGLDGQTSSRLILGE